MTGAMGQDDFTYPTLKDYKCQEYEPGFPITQFVAKTANYDTDFEFKVPCSIFLSFIFFRDLTN